LKKTNKIPNEIYIHSSISALDPKKKVKLLDCPAAYITSRPSSAGEL
jgi:hypothetical protein